MKPLLNISLGSHAITDGPCLSFAPKWFLPQGASVLLGQNGAGKTLLAKSIAGVDNYSANSFIPATAGELNIILTGRDHLPEQTNGNTLIIIDNPYIGLAEAEIVALDIRLARLVAQGCNIVLTTSDPRRIPGFAQSIIRVDNLYVRLPEDIRGQDIGTIRRGYKYLFGYAIDFDRIPQSLYTINSTDDIVCEAATIPLTIRRGQRIGLIGGTPSARSALFRELASVSSIPFGYIGQNFTKDLDGLTVIEAVGDGLPSADFDLRERTALATIWLDIFHNSHLADRKVATLSSGERQQIYLLHAIIGCPPLLILDEPMTSLDYGRRRSLRALINFIATRRTSSPTTLIVSTLDTYDMPECITSLYNISTHETQANINQ